MQFTRGQKSKLSALTPSQQIEVGVRLAGGGHESDTVACVVLGPDQKAVDPQSVVGAHAPTGGGGFIVWQGAKDGDTGVVWIDLSQLPAGQRLAIVVGSSQPFSTLTSGQVRLTAVGGGEVMTFPFAGSDFSGERALIVTELYVKDEWRVAAMGLGFNDGMPALLASYGAAPIPGAAPAAPAPPPAAPPPAPPPAAPPPAPPPPAAPPPPPAAPPPAPPPGMPPPAAPPPAAPPPAAPPPAAPPPAAPPPAAPPPAAPPPGMPPPTSVPPSGPFGGAAPPPAAPPPAAAPPPPAAAAPPPSAAPPPTAAPAAGPVNLGKVTLTKQGEQRSVSLRKGDASRPIHVNLNWQGNGGKRRGFLSGRSSAPDLDLGCMFELKDGRKSVIQPLGGNFGSSHGPPWIHLDKDDRSGSAADGENLYLVKPEHLERVMIFAMIYEGAPDFRSVGGYLSILDQDGQLTQIVLDNPDANRTFCSVALITTKADQVVIQKEERYFRHAEEADNYYAFGFNWRAGSKD